MAGEPLSATLNIAYRFMSVVRLCMLFVAMVAAVGNRGSFGGKVDARKTSGARCCLIDGEEKWIS